MSGSFTKMLFGIVCTLLMVYFHMNCIGCDEYYEYLRQHQTAPFWYSAYTIPLISAFLAVFTGLVFLLVDKNRILAFIVSFIPLLYIILIPTGLLTQMLK